MRRLVAVFPRFAFYLAGPVALYFAGPSLAGCASRPPSRERPVVACEFDGARRFTYALVVERVGSTATWVRRTILTGNPDANDKNERVSPSAAVRNGYCPDERASIADRQREVWRQEEPDHQQ